MDATVTLSEASRTTAGILFVSIVAVEVGGIYLVTVVRGREALTPFQVSFARAGHAHAGVLVILALVCQPYVDASTLDGAIAMIARSGVAVAAILMPAGFFLSSSGAQRTEPSRLSALVWAGAVCLAAGVLTLGMGLLSSV